MNVKRSCLALLFAVTLMFGLSTTASASDLDALVGEPVSESTTDVEPESGFGSIDLTGESEKNGTDALIDAIGSQETFTADSMARAQKLAAPVIALLNIVSSFLIVVLLAGVGVTTVLDLIFIGLPLTRQYLYPMYNQQVQGGAMQGGGMMSPVGGGYGGFGRSYGMGMGAMQGGMQGAQQPQMQKTSHQWVSDEAVKIIGLAQPTAQQQPMGMMVGMQQQQPQQPIGGKSVIFSYLKKRTVFIILFTFATVFLTSSILTGFGLKLFSFAQDLVAKFSGGM